MNELERPTQSRVWRWRRAIGESDLPAVTRGVLRALSEFMDKHGGECFPSQSDLVKKSGYSKNTVSAHLAKAAGLGWLDVREGIFTGQRHRRLSYVALFPSEGKVAHGMADDSAAVGVRMVQEMGQDNTSPSTSPNTSPENAGARALTRADRHRINGEFLKWLPTWPRYHAYSDATARREWFLLSDGERRECVRLTPAYLREFGNKRSSPGEYLKDRAWEGLPSSAAEPRPERIEVKSFSPIWMAARFWHLLQAPSGQIVITKFDQQMIDEGRATLDEIRRPKLIASGWPIVNAMTVAMRRSQPFPVNPAFEDYAGELRPVKKDSDLYAAWGRLHERRGWPFFSFAPAYLPFPSVDLGTDDLDAAVDAALTAFAELISKVE